jgi:hypothetical protein
MTGGEIPPPIWTRGNFLSSQGRCRDARFCVSTRKEWHFTLPDTNFSKLRQIMENDSLHSTIVDRFPIAKMTSPENFLSLLYYFGLLTITGSDEENKAILKIPNEASKRLYYDYIKETYEETGILTLEEAEAQLNRYSRDEKFQKAIGHTTLKKVVLIFCGTRLENQSEV